MSSTFVRYRKDFESGDIVGEFRVAFSDFVAVELDRLDRLVIDSEHKTGADIFQDLEILFRRMEEQKIVESQNTHSAKGEDE